MSETEILAPRCPGCDQPPMANWFVPFMCNNLECNVFTWDPYDDPAKFKAKAKEVDLSDVVDLSDAPAPPEPAEPGWVMHQWVIYSSPSDHPGMFVARRWAIRPSVDGTQVVPDGPAHVCGTLELAREVVAYHFPDGVLLQPSEGDDPCIAEVWI